MMGLDGCPRLYENTHPCITSRLYKDPTMIISIERVDMNVEQNTIPKGRGEKRREEKRLGCLSNGTGGNFAGQVFDEDGLCPTLTDMQGGGRQPHIVEVQKLNDTKFVYGREADIERLSDAVKDEEQHLCKLNKMPQGELSSLDDAEVCDIDAPVASTITARYYKGIGNHKDNMIMQATKVSATESRNIEQQIVAMRGRNPDNPSDRTPGAHLEQRLEPNEQGICNCLTSVSKDNMVHEKKSIKIRQATKDGFIDCEIGGVVDLDYPSSETRRGRAINKGQISPTLTTENIPSVIELGNPEFYNFLYEIDGDIYLIRIRKLIPEECWRLMNFSDEDFEKAAEVNSSTQLYKQAGNSIVKNVLVAIMGQLFEGKEDVYRKL